MTAHIVDGRFQSDKYPTCPPGKVPLSTRDPLAQDLLWAYAQRRRAVDAEFSEDLETCLATDGYDPGVVVSTADPGPHSFSAGIEQCPTWYDGCHCTVEALEHNIRRADLAEVEVDRLREQVQALKADRDRLQRACRTASDDLAREASMIPPSQTRSRVVAVAEDLERQAGI